MSSHRKNQETEPLTEPSILKHLDNTGVYDANPLQKRLWLLHRASQEPTLQALLMEACRRDILFWFDWFCWTFDPRQRLAIQPFCLYPYQRQLVQQLVHHLETGDDILIEKSRDMGVSWLVVLVFQYFWLFRAGRHFLIGSRKAELVDHKGDLSTLMEKFRFNLYHLPPWMRPNGFNPRTHDGLMKLLHPENGNTVRGESSNPQFSRGGRYTGILLDEFPYWLHDELAYTAAGQSSPCRITVGTPFGKNNTFARLRFSNRITVATLHWRLHPHKNDAWYQRETRRMSTDEIARELDINYQRSSSNRVFGEFGPQHISNELLPIPGRRLIRSWDFGYHAPACVFLQLDDQDQIRVLAEIVGHQEQLTLFAQRVIAFTEKTFEGFMTEDLCDPAGAQKSDKSTLTAIEILNSLGVFPFYQRSRILDGIELIRRKLTEVRFGQADETSQSDINQAIRPALLVHSRCEHLIAAFQGGYRYSHHHPEAIWEEHPFEDVMDCLRYAVMHKCGIPRNNNNRKAPRYNRNPHNPYTGY